MTTVLLDEWTHLAGKDLLTAGEFDITPNDVLYVIDMQTDFLPGGAFGVAEGDQTIAPIVNLMNAFADRGALVLASRDYHPKNHCSFATHGGPFPPHCIQGTPGSYFESEIAKTLNKLLPTNKAFIAYKGFCKDVDSFGAFEYSAEYFSSNRLSKSGGEGSRCASCWTGGYILESSNVDQDCNAPPDVMSVLEKVSIKDKLSTKEHPASSRRIFVCGLALDFCVLDTALNAVSLGFGQVAVVLDGARAAHIPGVGAHGTGFLSNPAQVRDQLQRAGVSVVRSSQLK